MRKMIFGFNIAAILLIDSFVFADKYNETVISYSEGVIPVVNDARFLGDSFVFIICDGNRDSEQERTACSLYRLKRVGDQFENMKKCSLPIYHGNYMHKLEPFGPDHVYIRLYISKFIVLNFDNCSYVESDTEGNYMGDLARIGANVEEVFSDSLVIFNEYSTSDGRSLKAIMGFDMQGDQFSDGPNLLNPLVMEAKEEYEKIQNRIKIVKGQYMYDRDNGLRVFPDDLDEPLRFKTIKSNNLIGQLHCDFEENHKLGCNVDQYDLNGQLQLSYKVQNASPFSTPRPLYNLPGGGFLMLRILHESFVANLTKVDSNGHLVYDREFIEFDLINRWPFDLQYYINDDDMDCVLYAEDFRSLKELHVSIKCNGAGSTLMHKCQGLIVCLLVCLLAFLA